MVPRLAGHALVQALIAQGCDTIFGVPGESYLAALDGLLEHRDRIRFVTCRHEGGAAFMAEAHGKLTRRPGVCFVTRGPGATNAAIGVHTAFQDGTPLLLLVGQVASDQRDREAFQELDYRHVFGPGTLGMAKWVGEVHDADRLPEYVARAYRVAMQGRPGPVVLVLPEDMLTKPNSSPVLTKVEPARLVPARESLARARALLAGAQRPLVIAGGGIDAASARALERFAERWRLPVACAFRWQDSFDNRHALYAGDVGLGIAPTLVARLRDSDLVLALGIRLSEMETGGYAWLQPPRPVQGLVHLHAGPEELGRVYAPDVALACSADAWDEALEALGSPTGPVPWQAWTDAAHADHEANHRVTEVQPLDLARVMQCVQRLSPPDTIYTNGAGNFSGWLQRYVRFAGVQHHGRTQLAPTSGAMGYGFPAAVAAALTYPERWVVNVAGDGDFLMTSQEMATAVACGVRNLVVLVVDNGSYGTIRMHQEREFPGRVSGSDLHNPDFAALARAYGWQAHALDRTEAFEDVYRECLQAGGPTLIHLRLSTDVITTRTSLKAIRDEALARKR
jgi:acetolactate synthase I/II/III large subunit